MIHLYDQLFVYTNEYPLLSGQTLASSDTKCIYLNKPTTDRLIVLISH